MKRDNPDHATAQRGQEAQQVLGNAAYIEAMHLLKQDTIDAWKACPIRDQEGQRLLLQLARLTDKFEALLAGFVEAGKLAHARLDLDEVRDESGVRRVLRKVI